MRIALFALWLAMVAPAHGLTLAKATRIADAAEAAATAAGYTIVVSLYDSHGNLKYFRRMDGTAVGSVEVSKLKAATSARFPLATASLAERSTSLAGNPYAGIPGLILLAGGLPIFDHNGLHVGGIGISGATPALDEQFAEAGLQAYAGP